MACGRRRTAAVRIFKSSSVISWRDPKGAELHVITEDDLKLLISGSVRTLEIRKFKLSGVVV